MHARPLVCAHSLSRSPASPQLQGGFTVTALGGRFNGMALNATLARCSFDGLVVPVRSIDHPGALNCTTPPMAMGHLQFALSLNGFDFTLTRSLYRAYPQEVHQIWPLAVPAYPGTMVTLVGDGFVAYDSASAPSARCRFLRVGAPTLDCERYVPSLLRSVPRSRCISRAVVLRGGVGGADEADEADDALPHTLGCAVPPAIARDANVSAVRVQLALNGVDFVNELLDGGAPRVLTFYSPPNISSIAPVSGAGGTPLVVRGERFDGLPTAAPYCVFGIEPRLGPAAAREPLLATRVTQATRISPDTLLCVSPSDWRDLEATARSVAAGSNVSGAPVARSQSTTTLVRVGISLNGADVTTPSGHAPPVLPLAMLPPVPPPAAEAAANASTASATVPDPHAEELLEGVEEAGAPAPSAPTSLAGARRVAEAATPVDASDPDMFALYHLPQLSQVIPTGGMLHGGLEVTIFGRGFGALRAVQAAVPAASSGQCRFGGSVDGIRTRGEARTDREFVCRTPAWAPRLPGQVPLELSLNALEGREDFDYVGGRPSPIFFTFSRPPTLSSILPAGGPISGGTRLFVRGSGFSGTSRSASSLCLLGGSFDAEAAPFNASSATDAARSSAATRPTSQLARCTAPPAVGGLPGAVAVRLALNGLEFHPQSASLAPVFTYYEPPTLVQLAPSQGPTGGSQLVTVVALGLARFGASKDALCMFGTHVVAARLKTAHALLCPTPPQLAGAVGVRISLNGQEFTPEAEALRYVYACGRSYQAVTECIGDPGCGFCEASPAEPAAGPSGEGGDGGGVGSGGGGGGASGGAQDGTGGGACYPIADAAACMGRWYEEVALPSSMRVHVSNVTRGQTHFYRLAMRLVPGTRTVVTVTSAGALVSLRTPRGGIAEPRKLNAIADGTGRHWQYSFARLGGRLAPPWESDLRAHASAESEEGDEDELVDGTAPPDEGTRGHQPACDTDEEVTIHLRVDGPRVLEYANDPSRDSRRYTSGGPPPLFSHFVIALSTALDYDGFGCHCDDASFYQLLAPPPMGPAPPASNATNATNATAHALAEDDAAAGVSGNASNTTAVNASTARGSLRLPRCIPRNGSLSANQTTAPPSAPSASPPLQLLAAQNGTLANASSGADGWNTTNHTAREYNRSVDANLTVSGTAGSSAGIAVDAASGGDLVFCDETDEEDDTLDEATLPKGVNATSDAGMAPVVIPECAAVEAERVERVTFAKLCGLELHHGATAIRSSVSASDAAGHAGCQADGVRPVVQTSTWLRLTNASGSIGTAWHATPLPLAFGFDTRFRLRLLRPGMPLGRTALSPGGGLAFVVQSDAQGTFAAGCSGGGYGFRADPDAYAGCSRRISRAVAVALLPDRAQVVRTDLDFVTPLATAYYPWGTRLDDGRVHRVRVRWLSGAGGTLAIFINDMSLPLLVEALNLTATALAADGTALVGFSAASSARLGDEVAVEVLDWQLAMADVAAEAAAQRVEEVLGAGESAAELQQMWQEVVGPTLQTEEADEVVLDEGDLD